MKVGSKSGLFPLELINQDKYCGYYIDKAGELFSIKNQAEPKLLMGRRSGAYRYYTLTSRSGNSMVFNGYVIFQEARKHPAFHAECHDAVTTPMPSVQTKITDRDHAASVQDGIKKRGYIIGQVQGEALVFGSKPAIHTSLKSVKAEIERLANKTPGLQLVYAKIEGAVRAASLVWE